ncbi:MAG: TIR domain-containing protein [Flavobacteriales bacterium]|nr:TIR domain-containing protein [Flavobacteriales bacterium]
MKYFISYTTRDEEITIDLLQSLSAELEKSGQVFVDIIDNDSLDKQERVISELDSSDTLILIESKSIYESEWVAIELERAEAKKIPIKKIKIEDLSNIKLNTLKLNCEKKPSL